MAKKDFGKDIGKKAKAGASFSSVRRKVNPQSVPEKKKVEGADDADKLEKRFTTYLTVKDIEQLKHISKLTGINVKTLMQKAVQKYLDSWTEADIQKYINWRDSKPEI